MAQATVRLDTRSTGADLRTVARELARMNDRKVKALFQRRLMEAARPFVPRVAASALAIPAKPGGRHTGLRFKIANCAQAATWEPRGTQRQVSVAVEIQPQKMPDREKGLPLYMQGVVDKARHNRWRHPVFQSGRNPNAPWVSQDAKPYFFRAADGFGRAAGEAMRRALDDITRQLNG